VPGVAAIGHIDPGGGGSRNEYGIAFGKADSYKTAYGPALCAVDSDGDGQSNGFELGDECCTWTAAAQTPLQSTSISNPGDKASVSTRPACDGTCGAGGGGGALPPCGCCSGPASKSSSPSPAPNNNPAGGAAASPAVIGGAAGGGGLIVGFAAAAALFGFGRRPRPTAGGEDDEEVGFAPLRGDEPGAPILRSGVN